MHRLTKDDLDLPPDLRILLAENYNLKTIADYETGPDAEISPDRARAAVQQAHRFVAYFTMKLGSPPSST